MTRSGRLVGTIALAGVLTTTTSALAQPNPPVGGNSNPGAMNPPGQPNPGQMPNTGGVPPGIGVPATPRLVVPTLGVLQPTPPGIPAAIPTPGGNPVMP